MTRELDEDALQGDGTVKIECVHVPEAEPGGRRWPGWAAVVVWALVIAVAFAVGWHRLRAGTATQDQLPPLHAQPRDRPLTWEMLPAVGVAAMAVAVLPKLAARLAWRWLLPVAWAGAALWAVSLAVSDGPGALAGPLNAPTEYPAGLARLRPDPLEWLSTFTERLYAYTTHVRGHPPLPMLALWLLEEAGLDGTGWAAAFVIAAGTSSVAAIAITLRRLASDRTARAAVPFLVLAPLALWIATSMDAFFLAVGAWGTALVALTARRRGARSAVVAAAAGGLLLGCLPYLSYGLLPLFAVPLTVLLLVRPRLAVFAAVGAGLLVVPTAFTLAGFWWPDGVRATLETYLISQGSAQRSYSYFLFANLAVLGLLVGPAVAHTMPRTLAAVRRSLRTRTFPRERAVPLPAGAALLGVIALDVSGVTKGEVERIWLPFAAWLVVAAALHRPPARGWLAAQALTALTVQALVLSPW